MTDSSPRPTIRKAPDTDRHPALAANSEVDLRDLEPDQANSEPQIVKKSIWSRLFSRA